MRKYLKEGQYSINEDEILGKGAFGKVYKGYDHTNSIWVAIKSINLEMLEFYGSEMKTIVCNQISVMRKFTNRMQEKPCHYLVKHYDCFRTDTYVYIVMELCQGGTLYDLLEKNTLTEVKVKEIMSQVIKGLVYLEELNICHRDLKPQNIYILEEFDQGKNEIFYKLGDFGFAAQKQSYQEVLGTYPFMAPEIFNREEYTSKVDVWALGIIAYQLIFKQLYFMGKDKWEIERKVKQSTFTLSEIKRPKISQQMAEFIEACLSKDQNRRPKASELFKLSWFTMNDKTVFEAIEHQLLYCELLRGMAEQFSDFGNAQKHKTQFIEMYLFKKAFSGLNLITYSLENKQNYLKIPSDMFQTLIHQKYSKELFELTQKVQKQNILTTQGFQSKLKQFNEYISKFKPEEQGSIKNILRPEEIYVDINRKVFKLELKKWIERLKQLPEYEQLKLKCQKLSEL